MEFDVILCGNQVGSVQVHICGLYYKFNCCCDLPERGAYRLQARCGDTEKDLGICIPMGNRFGLKTQIPVKAFGKGEWSFQLKTNHTETHVHYPISSDMPFSHLDLLDKAYFSSKNGKPAIAIRNH